MHDDSASLITATISGAILAASGAIGGSNDHLLETVPVSAGITGALLSGLKTRQSEILQTGKRFQWVVSVVSGVATAIFCGPVVTGTVFGFTTIPTITFAYFVLGLLGSTLVDMVIENRLILSNWLIKRGVRGIADPPPTPQQPPPAPVPVLSQACVQSKKPTVNEQAEPGDTVSNK